MEPVKLILAGWFMDGTGAPAKKNRILKINGKRIKSIYKADQSDIKNSEITDLSHCTILPPLIDSHAHLFMSGTSDISIRSSQLNAEFDHIKNVISNHLDKYLSHGILHVRDGGDSHAHTLRYKKECHDKSKNPVSIKTAGMAWRNHGRYGKLIGRPPRNNTTLAQAILEESNGIDHVKIVNSGLNSLIHFGKETPPQFSEKSLIHAINAAKSLGLQVMVHANGKIPVNSAIKAGCDSIEHGFFMGRENMEIMAEKNIFWVPTAYTMKAYSKILDKNSAESAGALKNFKSQIKQMALARKLKVPLALGTDSGSLGVHHGISVIEELKIFIEAGYSIANAVKCATFNGARLLGIKNGGILAPQKPATFLAVPGSPSDLPESLAQIEQIFINALPVKSIFQQRDWVN